MQNINIGPIRYNATLSAFEARVDIRRGGQVYRYPCQMAGPLTMPLGDVAQALKQQAMRMSDSGAALRSVTP